MKRLSILCLSFFLCVSASAQQLSKTDELFVDSLMKANYPQDAPGAVILIAKKGEPVFRKGYGLASMELNVPNKPENVFHIGSVSKQFTAVCILQLAQEGKLNLQDDIKKYLPAYNTHGRHITIEHLLTHTSGITSYTEKQNYESKRTIDQTKEELADFFMNDSLLFEPGTDWSYTNSGYIVAGLIVEKVSGLTLPEYCRQHIFIPAGMSSTFVDMLDSVVVNAASGYTAADNGRFKPAVYESPSWDFGCGGISSTLDDMLKWDNALYTDKIVKREWLDKAWKTVVLPNGLATNYGFGWAVEDVNGLQLIMHSGSHYGFVTDCIRIPSQQLFIAVTSNNDASGPWNITSVMALRLTGQVTTQPVFLHPAKKELAAYTGVYAIHRIGSRVAVNYTDEKLYRRITAQGDTLFSQAAGGPKEAIHCIAKDLFVSDGEMKFRFHRDKKGLIEFLELYSEPIKYGPNEIEPKTNQPLPKEKQAVVLDAKTLKPLEGKYDLGSGYFIQVRVEGNKIYIQATGEDKEEIFPENETTFFLKSVNGSVRFKKENGRITGLVLNAGMVFVGKKVE